MIPFIRQLDYELTIGYTQYYDEDTAYAVLSASPRLLSKKPRLFFDAIKALYALSFRNQELASKAMGESKDTFATSTYAMLFFLISEAPGVLKLTPQDIKGRLAWLGSMFTGSEVEPESFVAQSPRLLTEPPGKIRFWVEGIRHFTSRGLIKTPLQTMDTGASAAALKLVQINPKTLVSSLSLLARIPYASAHARGPLDHHRVSTLIHCNTEDFVSRLQAASGDIHQRAHYARHLSSVCALLQAQSDDGSEGLAEDDPASTERYLCGILNKRARDTESDLSPILEKLCAVR